MSTHPHHRGGTPAPATNACPAVHTADLTDARNYHTPVKAVITMVELSQFRTVKALAEAVMTASRSCAAS